MKGLFWLLSCIVLSFFSLSVHSSPNCTDYCTIKSISLSPIQGINLLSPDGTKYLVNQLDPATQKTQIYIGNVGSDELTCITCTQYPNGPSPHRYHYQPAWHPSGEWIFMSVENDYYYVDLLLFKVYIINGTCDGPDAVCSAVLGWIQSGIYVNLWVCSIDGVHCYQLTNFSQENLANGYTGPAISPDGKTLVWSQIVGNPLVYVPFGGWQLIRANFEIVNGLPTINNETNITPNGMNWNEPGCFNPVNGDLLYLTGSFDDSNQQGMDQYVLNVRTGDLVDLNNTPSIWDEHGLVSPNGKLLIFTSAYPYRADSSSSTVAGYKTEIMMMNAVNGSGQVQLTHFRTPGYVESGDASAAVAFWNRDGNMIFMYTISSNFN
eukprot:TRINITY_DN760_c0_g1_i2.p1 TRINITY_DN760_c0_g1~~TRINITY_DN760_c0_g1_i2.p1  ORF type:complete len:378 (-),score=68.78 TRINITY_DN760_c0_g1_i2:190-1323(-)